MFNKKIELWLCYVFVDSVLLWVMGKVLLVNIWYNYGFVFLLDIWKDIRNNENIIVME